MPYPLHAAFLDEPPHVELPPGEHLYKFVSIPIVRQRILESPWWIRQQAFDELQIRARRLQKPMADWFGRRWPSRSNGTRAWTRCSSSC